MFCSNCGKELSGNFCSNCGHSVEKKQQEISSPESAIDYGTNQRNVTFVRDKNEYVNPRDGHLGCVMNLVCFSIPLVGFILYAIWLNTMPKRAKEALNAAIFPAVIVIAIIVFAFVMSVTGTK